VIQSTNWT